MSQKRIYVDTNVLVNYFTRQSDDVQCLDYLFSKVRKEILFTSSLAVVQAISILQTKKEKRKKFVRAEIIECNKKLNASFSIIDLVNSDIQNGEKENNEDVEDNVHLVLAEKLRCEVVITNNTKDFAYFRNRVISLTPKDMGKVRKLIQ
jgi:predicted nucleic acid-binding protein